jgi:hypothetical protein
MSPGAPSLHRAPRHQFTADTPTAMPWAGNHVQQFAEAVTRIYGPNSANYCSCRPS